jgi:hypothetical protein
VIEDVRYTGKASGGGNTTLSRNEGTSSRSDFGQEPVTTMKNGQPGDLATAKPGRAVGAGNKTVYFYNNGGYRKMGLEKFLNIGRTR